MPFLNLIQGYFVPSSITCVNSMEVSYIPIAKARGFTTHWIKKLKFSFIGYGFYKKQSDDYPQLKVGQNGQTVFFCQLFTSRLKHFI